MRALLIAVLSLAAATTAAQTSPDRAADEHLERADALFQKKNYQGAIDELRSGYFIKPQPRFLYALGQVYRQSHQCKEALSSYREFLTYNPPPKQADATKQSIAQCEAELKATGQPASAPDATREPATSVPPPAELTTPQPEAIVATPPKRRLYKRWWLWTTVGVVAAAGLAVGLGVGLTTNRFSTSLQAVGRGPGGAPQN